MSISPRGESERRNVVTLVERGSAHRQRRIVHEIMMQVEWLVVRSSANIGAVWLQYPALLVIDQIGHEYLIENLVVDGRIPARHHIFDAAIEIARNQVGRRDEENGRAAC